MFGNFSLMALMFFWIEKISRRNNPPPRQQDHLPSSRWKENNLLLPRVERETPSDLTPELLLSFHQREDKGTRVP